MNSNGSKGNKNDYVKTGSGLKQIPSFQQLLGDDKLGVLSIAYDGQTAEANEFLAQLDEVKLSTPVFFTDSLQLSLLGENVNVDLRELPCEDNLSTPDGNLLVEVYDEELYGLPVYHVHICSTVEVEGKNVSPQLLNGLKRVSRKGEDVRDKRHESQAKTACVKIEVHGYVTSQLQTLYEHTTKTFSSSFDDSTETNDQERPWEISWELVSDPRNFKRLVLRESVLQTGDLTTVSAQFEAPENAALLTQTSNIVFMRLAAIQRPLFRPQSAARPFLDKEAPGKIFSFIMLTPAASTATGALSAAFSAWKAKPTSLRVLSSQAINGGIPIVQVTLSRTGPDSAAQSHQSGDLYSAALLEDGQLVSAMSLQWRILVEAKDFKKGSPLYQTMQDVKFNGDIELLSEYREIKRTLSESYRQQLACNPEGLHILSDWMQAVLHHKPENVFSFTQEYFQTNTVGNADDDVQMKQAGQITVTSNFKAPPTAAYEAEHASRRQLGTKPGAGSLSRPASATGSTSGSFSKLSNEMAASSSLSYHKLSNFAPTNLANSNNSTSSFMRASRELAGGGIQGEALPKVPTSLNRRYGPGSAGSRHTSTRPSSGASLRGIGGGDGEHDEE